MSNVTLLKELGWPDDLIAECERASAALSRGLPAMAVVDGRLGPSALATTSSAIVWRLEPVATNSIRVSAQEPRY